MFMKKLSVLILTLAAISTAVAQREHGVRPTSTGGTLHFEQAAFDVQSYEVNLNVTPSSKSISGVPAYVARFVCRIGADASAGARCCTPRRSAIKIAKRMNPSG